MMAAVKLTRARYSYLVDRTAKVIVGIGQAPEPSRRSRRRRDHSRPFVGETARRISRGGIHGCQRHENCQPN